MSIINKLLSLFKTKKKKRYKRPKIKVKFSLKKRKFVK